MLLSLTLEGLAKEGGVTSLWVMLGELPESELDSPWGKSRLAIARMV